MQISAAIAALNCIKKKKKCPSKLKVASPNNNLRIKHQRFFFLVLSAYKDDQSFQSLMSAVSQSEVFFTFLALYQKRLHRF